MEQEVRLEEWGQLADRDYRYLLPQRLLLQHLSKAVPAGWYSLIVRP